MIRRVGEDDPARMETVFDWALRDLFLAYLSRIREEVRAEHYVDLICWASLAPYAKRGMKRPDTPKILKG